MDDPDPLPDLSGYDVEELQAKTGDVFTTGAVGSNLKYRVLIQPGDQGRPLREEPATIGSLEIELADYDITAPRTRIALAVDDHQRWRCSLFSAKTDSDTVSR